MGAQYYVRSNKYSLQERQTKRGKVYDVVFRVVTLDGIEKQKKLSGYTTKALAKNAYLQFVTEYCTFRKNAPLKKQDAEKKVLTVDDLFPEYIAAAHNQIKESTIYDKYGIYKRHIAPALGGMTLENLTKETLYRWQDEPWRTKNPTTNDFYSYKHLTNIRSVLYAFLVWAETRYGFTNNLQSIPKPKKRLPKRAMQFWTKEQFEQFISCVDDPMYHALGFAEKPLEVLHPESINMILITSIVAGIFIIVCAIGTGIISNFRRGVIAKTLFSVNGVAGLVFYLALVCLLLPMLGVQASFIGSVPYIVLLIVIPFLCMYFCEPLCLLFEGKHPGKPGEIIINGFFEMFDALLSFASNTMSFLRVGGFVLAHAGMMSVVFTLANMTTQPVIYWIIVVIGNLFVMALEGLFVGIQVLRLEFYEIFSRFFDAEGRPFTPLHVRSGKELLES